MNILIICFKSSNFCTNDSTVFSILLEITSRLHVNRTYCIYMCNRSNVHHTHKPHTHMYVLEHNIYPYLICIHVCICIYAYISNIISTYCRLLTFIITICYFVIFVFRFCRFFTFGWVQCLLLQTVDLHRGNLWPQLYYVYTYIYHWKEIIKKKTR